MPNMHYFHDCLLSDTKALNELLVGGKPDKIALCLIVLRFVSEYYHSFRFLASMSQLFIQHKENVPHSRQSNNICILKVHCCIGFCWNCMADWCSTLHSKVVFLVTCICVCTTTENFQSVQVLVCRTHRVPSSDPLPPSSIRSDGR